MEAAATAFRRFARAFKLVPTAFREARGGQSSDRPRYGEVLPEVQVRITSRGVRTERPWSPDLRFRVDAESMQTWEPPADRVG